LVEAREEAAHRSLDVHASDRGVEARQQRIDAWHGMRAGVGAGLRQQAVGIQEVRIRLSQLGQPPLGLVSSRGSSRLVPPLLKEVPAAVRAQAAGLVPQAVYAYRPRRFAGGRGKGGKDQAEDHSGEQHWRAREPAPGAILAHLAVPAVDDGRRPLRGQTTSCHRSVTDWLPPSDAKVKPNSAWPVL